MKKQTFINKANSIAKNAAANVVAAPLVAKSRFSSRNDESDYKALRKANEYAGAPDFDSSGSPTDAFKARSAADGVKSKLNKKNKSK